MDGHDRRSPPPHLTRKQGCGNCPTMHPRDKATIDLAVQILRAAVDTSRNAKVDTLPVRLALRVLLPHCPERWPLVNLWESAGQENDIGRSQGVNAAFNGVVLQLGKSGAWRE